MRTKEQIVGSLMKLELVSWANGQYLISRSVVELYMEDRDERLAKVTALELHNKLLQLGINDVILIS